MHINSFNQNHGDVPMRKRFRKFAPRFPRPNENLRRRIHELASVSSVINEDGRIINQDFIKVLSYFFEDPSRTINAQEPPRGLFLNPHYARVLLRKMTIFGPYLVEEGGYLGYGQFRLISKKDDYKARFIQDRLKDESFLECFDLTQEQKQVLFERLGIKDEQ